MIFGDFKASLKACVLFTHSLMSLFIYITAVFDVVMSQITQYTNIRHSRFPPNHRTLLRHRFESASNVGHWMALTKTLVSNAAIFKKYQNVHTHKRSRTNEIWKLREAQQVARAGAVSSSCGARGLWHARSSTWTSRAAAVMTHFCWSVTWSNHHLPTPTIFFINEL